MEDWKKRHINTNIVLLIETTCCSVALISRLRAKGILTKEDIEELESVKCREGETKQVNRFYDIFVKKSSKAYESVIQALYDSGQEAPAEILVKGFVDHGKQPGEFVRNHDDYKSLINQTNVLDVND